MKSLRPKEDEGVYTLKSDHLVLDTPQIVVKARVTDEKPEERETVVEEIEEETIVIQPSKPTVDVEIVEQEEETVSRTDRVPNDRLVLQLPEIKTKTTSISEEEERTQEEKPTIETLVSVEEEAPVQSPTVTEKFDDVPTTTTTVETTIVEEIVEKPMIEEITVNILSTPTLYRSDDRFSIESLFLHSTSQE